MAAVFWQALPFFALLGCGFVAVRLRLFALEGVRWLSRFVFLFALSAMLFRFAARLDFSALLDPPLLAAYLAGTGGLYLLVMLAGRLRGAPFEEAVIEAQASVIGNVGFMGVPMLVALMGEAAAGPILLVLATDLLVFGTAIGALIAFARGGRMSLSLLWPVIRGALSNPMVIAMATGLAWSASGLPLGGAFDSFLQLLGSAATPGALFAIGATLAGTRLARPTVAFGLSVVKLALHPLAVLLAASLIGASGYPVKVAVAAAALPTAGNVYLLAEHYRIAPERVSSTIFLSTLLSILSIPVVLTLIGATPAP